MIRCQNFYINKSTIFYNILLISNITPERVAVAAGEEVIDVGLGVPVLVSVTGVVQEAVVAETFQIAVFDSEKSHQCFVGLDTGDIYTSAEKGILLSR